MVAVGAFSALFLALYRYIVEPLFFSPLSKIPNAHWSSPFSDIWILLIRYRLKENRTLLSLHQKNGPILRLGPNDISINTIDNGVKTIYGGGFEKGQWYSIFDNYGVTCTFSALPSKSHSATKRMVSHTYSALNLFNSKALAAQSYHLIYRRLLPHIYSLKTPKGEEEKCVDVLSLFYSSSMDAITGYQFGLRNSSNMIEDEKARRHFLNNLYQPRKVYAYFGQELPKLSRWLKVVGIRLVPKWVDAANDEIEAWCKGMCSAATEDVERRKAGGIEEAKVEDEPVVVGALLKGIEKEEKKDASVLEERIRTNKELMVCTEMLDHLAAGHETSGITLSYMAYHLSKDLELQKELRQELLTLDPPIVYGKGAVQYRLPDPKQIDGLPLLHAIMMETLRLNAAIPGSTPRVTPYPSSNLAGYQIPGGVRVSSSAWSLHRNSEVFPDPDRWDHRRWLLDESGEKDQRRREMDKWYWAFSSGGRMCLGNNFAIMRKSQTSLDSWLHMRRR